MKYLYTSVEDITKVGTGRAGERGVRFSADTGSVAQTRGGPPRRYRFETAVRASTCCQRTFTSPRSALPPPYPHPYVAVVCAS